MRSLIHPFVFGAQKKELKIKKTFTQTFIPGHKIVTKHICFQMNYNIYLFAFNQFSNPTF